MPDTRTSPFTDSLRVEQSLPARRLASSDRLGWRSVLARHYRDPAHAETFTTLPTDDLLVVLVTGGRYVIESRHDSRWTREEYRPGAVGVTAPGRTSTMRWRAVSAQPMESLHLFLSADLVTETLQGPGQAGRPRPVPDALLLRDRFVEGTGHALLRAMKGGAPSLYADSLAQSLAVHLLHTAWKAGRGPDRVPRRAGALSERALRKVVDHMHDHLHEEITLDQLAGVVHISKFHLLRMFTETTGLTPHRYLTEMRLARAASLLMTTDRRVLDIALACGYNSPGRFAHAFRRQYGTTPAHFRDSAA